MTRKKEHITAAILAALMILIVLLSAGAVVLEATHDCDGAECRVCDIIHTLGNMIRGWALIAVILLFTISISFQLAHRDTTARCLFRATPVTDKVVMLN